jgi:stage III sporulation protein AB
MLGLTIISSVAIIGGCGYIGQIMAERIHNRCRDLAAYQQGLLALAREIGYGNTLLPAALAVAARVSGGRAGFFADSAAILQKEAGISAGEAWAKALAAQKSLPAPEKEALTAFGEGLGLSDTADQLKRIEIHRLRLAAIEETVKEEYARLGKIWRSMGWCTGVIIVLLII